MVRLADATATGVAGVAKSAGLEKSDRLMPSVATALYAALKGAAVLRVHDVEATREALAMVGALRLPR